MKTSRRTALGALLLLHGIAHSAPGLAAPASQWIWIEVWSEPAVRWATTLLWGTGLIGFVAAGFGALYVEPFVRHWRRFALVATGASIAFLSVFQPPWWIPGIMIDAFVAVLLLGSVETAEIPEIEHRHPRLARVSTFGVMAMLLYVAAVSYLRPWHGTWGSSSEELQAALPGDERSMLANYQIQHAIVVDAPRSAVWPWLVQIGQDRAGFYSYSRLENLVLADIHNADRIHPEWQQLRAGDRVRLASARIYGDRPLLRVSALEPEHYFVLEGWGAFVLEPIDSLHTKLIVRTRGRREGLVGFASAPVDLFLFEPIHFLMQRRMLIGIRDRAEGSWRTR
jgi:hypothetical protein